MPPRRSTVREMIYYEYAKLIADAAVSSRTGLEPAQREGHRYWSFVMATYRRLLRGEITPSTILRENKLLVSRNNQCAYCGATEALEWEHVIPRSAGGPNTMDNLVLSCGPCNRRKGAKDPLVWYAGRRNEIPRLVMGKVLKLLLTEHESRGTLDATTYPDGHALRLEGLVAVFGVDFHGVS